MNGIATLPKHKTALMFAVAMALASPPFGAVSVAAQSPSATSIRPSLATRDQIAAEQLALQILASPDVRAAKEKVLEQLFADPDGQGDIGRAQAAAVLDQWTTYLALTVAIGDVERPRIVTMTDSRPHKWGDEAFPAIGLPISNPDNIYRSTLIDGGHRYELSGRFGHPRPGQFSVEITRRSTEDDLSKQSKNFGDMGNQVAMLTDDKLDVRPDGSFVITIDPEPANGRTNHVQGVASR
jgi:hypothetical protein